MFAVLTCNPALFVYQSLGLVPGFRLPTFFVSTVNKEAVTNCKFAMQAEEVCVYIRRSSLICVAHLQVYERVANNRWWPNIGGLLY